MLATIRGPKLLSPFVLAELGYFLSHRATRHLQRELLTEVEQGAYRLEPFYRDDIATARQVIDRYTGLNIGLTDASLVVLAERYDTLDILTLDQRHFSVVTRLDGRPFRLLPADA